MTLRFLEHPLIQQFLTDQGLDLDLEQSARVQRVRLPSEVTMHVQA